MADAAGGEEKDKRNQKAQGPTIVQEEPTIVPTIVQEGPPGEGPPVEVVQVQNTNQICKDNPTLSEIINYCSTNKIIEESSLSDLCTLYNNGKFYYTSGESVGSLVSYSCATVLLNTILRKLPQNAAVIKPKISGVMNSLLQIIQNLQQQVGSKKNDNADEDGDKDWAKICTKIKPLVFKKGGSDCIFYNDVAGLNKEKKMLDSSLIYPLIYPNLYPKTAKGILIYGPPGTGKTYLIKASVNELQSKDPNVGVLFFTPSPGDLKGKYVGETEKRIEEAFRCASDAACEHETKCPDKKKYISIIFMDEMDAIAPDRDKDNTGLAVNSVNTLLQMMDGIKSFPNVCVVGATNYPWDLDGAILRRFDTQILIDLPSEADLKELFNMSMNRYIGSLQTDKTTFNYCDSSVDNKSNNGDDNKLLGCTVACTYNNSNIEKYTTDPYNRFNIEYFNNNKKDGLVDGIVYFLAKENYSNSDLDRLIKSASTNAGELAVKSNLFYSPIIMDILDKDMGADKYISCLTEFMYKDKISNKIDFDKKYEKCIAILTGIVGNTAIPNIVQLNPPEYVRIVHDGFWYYNIKCLLWKNTDIILQHHTIKDIYIKGHKTETNFPTKLEYYENILGKTKNLMLKSKSFWEWLKTRTYNTLSLPKYVLDWLKPDVFRLEEIAESINDIHDDSKELVDLIELFMSRPECAFEFDIIDIIIAFDFTFKKTDIEYNTNVLLPIPRDLINSVFVPIYNRYSEDSKKAGPSAGAGAGAPIARAAGAAAPTDSGYNIRNKATLEGTYQNTDLTKPFINIDDGTIKLSSAADKLINNAYFQEEWNAMLRKQFTSIEKHKLDLFNYLLLMKCLQPDEATGPADELLDSVNKFFGMEQDVMTNMSNNPYLNFINTDGLISVGTTHTVDGAKYTDNTFTYMDNSNTLKYINLHSYTTTEEISVKTIYIIEVKTYIKLIPSYNLLNVNENVIDRPPALLLVL